MRSKINAYIILSLLSSTSIANPEHLAKKEKLRAAFEKYIQVIKDTEEAFLNHESSDLSDADLVGAYDLILGNLQINLRSHLSSSGTSHRGRPRFASFDDPDTRVGVDNPDTQYMTTTIHNESGSEVYKVYGKRGTSKDMLLQVFDPTSGNGGKSTLRAENMRFKFNGSYEVYLSTKEKRNPRWKNWMEIPKARGINVIRRHSHCNWRYERPGSVHIERIGTAGVINHAPKSADMIKQIEDGATVYKNQTGFFVELGQRIKKSVPANYVTPWRSTGDVGQPDQFTVQMWYNLKDDEALIIKLPEPKARYYGLQAANFWGSSLDWQHNVTSLSWGFKGRCQAERSRDKNYYFVVSAKDPGVKNWINIKGYKQGMLFARLQGVSGNERNKILNGDYNGTSKVVKISELRNHLPKRTKHFSVKDRMKQIKVRQNFARKKYKFW